jgi:hypothetical protein
VTIRAAGEAAIAETWTWRQTDAWNAPDTASVKAAELLIAPPPRATVSPAEAADAPLGDRVDHLRESLATLRRD